MMRILLTKVPAELFYKTVDSFFVIFTLKKQPSGPMKGGEEEKPRTLKEGGTAHLFP